MPQRRKIYSILLQVILWGLFLVLPYFSISHTNDTNQRDLIVNRISQPNWEEYNLLTLVSLNLCLIVFFYIHQWFIFDRYILTNKYAGYITVIVISFLVIFGVSYYIREILLSIFSLFERPLEARDVIRTATWFVLILFAAFGIKIADLWRKAEERNRAIETEHLRTELSFLHMQINPHFLFNSLNTIYGLSLKKSDNAPKAVLKLSQLLRYMIEENGQDKVPLDQEVTYLNNYIEMQKMRSASSLSVNFEVKGNTSMALIAPMLLLPFVENAFKYGISNSGPSPIDILLSVDSDSIIFTVTNQKFDYLERHSSGIGIPNVQRRLELLYPGSYELDIKDQSDIYSLSLKILLS
jgi:two-component system LytT family sensor kinase